MPMVIPMFFAASAVALLTTLAASENFYGYSAGKTGTNSMMCECYRNVD